MAAETGNLSNTERTWSALLGASLSLLALRRGSSTLRSLEAVTGAALLARSIAGHCGIKAALTGQTSLSDGLSDQWRRMFPESRVQQQSRAAYEAKSDAVDKSVEDSFPASDPPASRLSDEPPVNADAKWKAAQAAHGPSEAWGNEPAQGRTQTRAQYADRPTDDGKYGDADQNPAGESPI